MYRYFKIKSRNHSHYIPYFRKKNRQVKYAFKLNRVLKLNTIGFRSLARTTFDIYDDNINDVVIRR